MLIGIAVYNGLLITMFRLILYFCIFMQGDHHILCSAISMCAGWAAFSDVYHISLFKLNLVSAINPEAFQLFGSLNCLL